MTVGMITSIALGGIALWQLYRAARWEDKAGLYRTALLTMAESLGQNGVDVDIEEREDGISVSMQFPLSDDDPGESD